MQPTVYELFKSHSFMGAIVNSRRNRHMACRQKYKCGDLDNKMFYVHWSTAQSSSERRLCLERDCGGDFCL